MCSASDWLERGDADMQASRDSLAGVTVRAYLMDALTSYSVAQYIACKARCAEGHTLRAREAMHEARQRLHHASL